MWRLIRSTLMSLLAVALPLQGVSAATMLACTAGHHRASILTEASHSTGAVVASHAHIHIASAAHHHADVDRVAPPKTDLGKSLPHQCSACASCCLSAVVLPAEISFDAVTSPDFFVSLIARSLAGHIEEGLERPPRLFLA